MQQMLPVGLLSHLPMPFMATSSSWPLPPLPAFLDLDQQYYHQSPDLERPPSPQSFHPGVTGYPWPVIAFAHSTGGLPPLLPSPHMMASSTSPTTPEPSSPSSSPGKRKRGGAKPKKEAPSSSTAQQQQSGQSTAQVVKWKLNTPRYKRLKVQTEDGGSEWKRCEHCGTDSTPEWRTGPLGKGTLCNACGLRYRSKLREQKKRDTTKTPSGTVPMSLLLNPASNGTTGCKKGRTCVNNPMIWETKVSASSPGSQIADLLN